MLIITMPFNFITSLHHIIIPVTSSSLSHHHPYHIIIPVTSSSLSHHHPYQYHIIIPVTSSSLSHHHPYQYHIIIPVTSPSLSHHHPCHIIIPIFIPASILGRSPWPQAQRCWRLCCSSLPSSSFSPMIWEKRMPIVMASWWQVPMAPRIFFGEISARYSGHREMLSPDKPITDMDVKQHHSHSVLTHPSQTWMWNNITHTESWHTNHRHGCETISLTLSPDTPITDMDVKLHHSHRVLTHQSQTWMRNNITHTQSWHTHHRHGCETTSLTPSPDTPITDMDAKQHHSHSVKSWQTGHRHGCETTQTGHRHGCETTSQTWMRNNITHTQSSPDKPVTDMDVKQHHPH